MLAQTPNDKRAYAENQRIDGNRRNRTELTSVRIGTAHTGTCSHASNDMSARLEIVPKQQSAERALGFEKGILGIEAVEVEHGGNGAVV